MSGNIKKSLKKHKLRHLTETSHYNTYSSYSIIFIYNKLLQHSFLNNYIKVKNRCMSNQHTQVHIPKS